MITLLWTAIVYRIYPILYSNAQNVINTLDMMKTVMSTGITLYTERYFYTSDSKAYLTNRGEAGLN